MKPAKPSIRLAWIKKSLIYLFAMVLLGTSVALIQSTNMGMSAWDAWHRNFYEGVPIAYKYLNPISALILVSLAYLIEWKKPSLWMFFPILISFAIGAIIDFELLFMPVVSESHLLWNVLYLLLATILVGVGLNLIVYCQFPLPALDQFCMALAKRFKLTFGQGKYIGEFTALLGTIVTGLFFQSQSVYFYLGFTTVFYLLVLGFVIDLFRNPLFRLLKGIPTLELMRDDLLPIDVVNNRRSREVKAVIWHQDKVLLIHQKAEDIYYLPGTVVKQRYSLEKALKLHVQTEYQLNIRLRDEKVMINDHALGYTTEHHYFDATLTKKNNLQQNDLSPIVNLCWVDINTAMDLLSNHDTLHPEAMHGMWREFLGLINAI